MQVANKTWKGLLGWALGLTILKALLLALAIHSVQSAGDKVTLCSWDCGYYKDIAEIGYSYNPGHHGTLAFFPGFPHFVQFIKTTFLTSFSFEVVATGVNLALYFVFIFLFLVWCSKLGIQFIFLPALLISVDRFSFWAQVPYTEPLFCSLLLAGFLIMRNQNLSDIQKWLLTSFIGGSMSAVRLVGLSSIAALGLSQFRRFLKNPFLGVLCLALGVWGVVSYFSYVHISFGSWTKSFETTAAWGRHFDFWGIFTNSFEMIRRTYLPTMFLLPLTLWFIAKPPAKIALNHYERLCFLFLTLIPLANSIYVSLTRYLSILFLGHIALAYLFEKNFSWKNLRHSKQSQFALALLIVFCISELYWQHSLIAKFLRTEVFNWAS